MLKELSQKLRDKFSRSKIDYEELFLKEQVLRIKYERQLGMIGEDVSSINRKIRNTLDKYRQEKP